jgi:hypothetical protein
MQSDQAPSSVLKWRAMWLGIMLGTIQAVLFFLVMGGFWFNNFGWSFIVSATFFYLLIPALEGFLSARRNADVYAGVGAGGLAGGTSIPTFIIGAIIASVVLLNLPDPGCPPNCPGPYFFSLEYFRAIDYFRESVPILIFVAAIVAGIGGLGGGFLGGWMGSNLGQRFAHTSNQRSSTAKHDEP